MIKPNKIKRKRGRAAAHYIASDGKQIEGLAQRPSDGRWRVIGTDITFSEADEAKAIAKFKRLTGAKSRTAELWDSNAMFTAEGMDTIIGRILSAEDPEEEFYIVAGETIRKNPILCATKMKIEQLGWMDQLKPPTPVPALLELLKNYEDGCNDISADQKYKVVKHFKEFLAVTGAINLSDFSPKLATVYKNHIEKILPKKKSQKHRVANIRTLLRWNILHGFARKEISDALAELIVLQIKKAKSIPNPRPIKVEEWKKLYAEAQGDDKRMILLMLNCGLYAQDVIRLKWEDFRDDCLVQRREKTGQCLRVSVLWEETKAAIAELPKDREYLFISSHGKPLSRDGFEKRWIKLREKKNVEMPHLTPSQLRDGTSTAMALAGISKDQQNTVMGHEGGISDDYILRDKELVAKACEAIHAKYFAVAA